MEARTYHHGNLRAALVQAGLAILEADGLDGLSLRACAARAGVSHAAPRNHFDGLRGLIGAITAEGFRRHAAAMRADVTDGMARELRLIAVLRGYHRFATENPALYKLMFSRGWQGEKDAELLDAAASSYGVLEEIARDLSWTPAAGAGGEEETRMMLWSFAHGFADLSINGRFWPVQARLGRMPGPDEAFPAQRYAPPRDGEGG